MKLLRRSLTLKLTAWALLLSIVSLTIISYTAFHSAQEAITDRTIRHLESVSLLKQQEIDNWIEHTEHSLAWIAEQPQISRDAMVLVTYPPDDPQRHSARESLVMEFNGAVGRDSIQLICLMDGSSGEVIAASDETWEGKLFESQPYFLEGQKGTYISGIYHSPSLGAPTMVMVTPVKDASGELCGVLAAYIALEGLNRIMLETGSLGQTGETYLVSADNLRLTDSRFAPGTAFREMISTRGVIEGFEKKSAAALYPGYRGVPVIGSSRWLDNVRAVLLAEIDQSEAFAPLARMRNIMLIVGSLLIVAVLGVGVVATQRTTGPITRLVDYARRVERGDYSSKPEIRGRDETARLTSHINSIVERLAAREHRLHDLSRRLVEVQEEEKRAIARELHDQTSQSLALTKMLMDKASSGPPDERVSWLGKAQEELSVVIEQVREMSLNLRPAMLDDLGLPPTLYWHFERYTARTNIKVNFHHEGLSRHLPPEVRIATYRIVQEALNNVARHARVNEVTVRLRAEKGRLSIRVEDQGAGFDFTKVSPSSTGLSGMQERVNLLSGNLTIETAPGAGTRLTVEIPIPEQSEGGKGI